MRYQPPTTLSLHPRRFPWVRLLLGALGVLWASLAIRDVRRTTAARQWPEAVGTLRTPSVRARAGFVAAQQGAAESTREIHSGAALEYRFTASGSEWRASRVNVTEPPPRGGFRFRPRVWLNGVDRQGAARRYLTSRRVTVRYNPRDPRDAALDVSTPIPVWIELAAGLGLVVLAVPYRRPLPES